MTLSTVTAFSGITDKAPASPAYLNSKFSEVYDIMTAMNVGIPFGAVTSGSTTTFPVAQRFVLRSIDSGGAVYNVLAYNADNTGTTDSATAILNCITDASAKGGGIVFFPEGTYKVGSQITLASGIGSNTQLVGSGMAATVLKKSFNGTMFPITGISYFGMRDLTLDGNYEGGSTGKGIVVTGAGSTNYHRYTNVFWKSIEDTHMEIGTDACEMTTWVGCQGLVGAGQALGSVAGLHHNGADTGARHRTMTGCVFNGSTLSLNGAVDFFIGQSLFNVVKFGSACQIMAFQGCLMGGNSGTSVDGDNITIMGCRFAGDVELTSGMGGACSFIGNVQTSGGFVNNAGINVCLVSHHSLSVNYDFLNRHQIYSGSQTPGVVRTYRRTTPGDAKIAYTPEAGVSDIYYGTTLTSARTVSLSTVNALDGVGVAVARPAGGAFDLGINWGTGATSILTLDQNTWGMFNYNGTGYEVVAAGSLTRPVSSISTKVAGLTVQGSASSFTIVAWPQVAPGDQIFVTIQPDAAVSSLSSGLVLHSHCTQAGQVELRWSNVSTLQQVQSSKTYYLTRMTPF